MTRTAYARIAGFMFLFYIATAVPGVWLFESATHGTLIAAKLTNIADHAVQMRAAALLSLLMSVNALVLAVALYAITRDQYPDLALLAFACRTGEAIVMVIPTLAILGLLSVATGMGAGPVAGADAAVNEVSALLFKVRGWGWIAASTLFAVGSTIYSWLFLCARSIPAPLAWLGIVASALLVFGLPPQLFGYLTGPVGVAMWAPLLLFEVVLGFWLLIRGVAPASP